MGQTITSCGYVIGKGSHYFKNLLIVQAKLLPVTTCFKNASSLDGTHIPISRDGERGYENGK